MQRVLEMMLDALLETWRASSPWLSDAVSTVPTWAWASLVTLGLLWVAVRMVRPTRVDAGAEPDLLLTRVELTADRPGSDRYAVDVGFSNLHHEPVQLLRLAVDGRTGRSVVRDVPAIVPARRAVDLDSAVTLTPGGRGRLDLYAVVPSSPAKAWRLRVPLEWEPFQQRYSAVLLDQTVRAVRRLPRTSEIEARPSVDTHRTESERPARRRPIQDTPAVVGVRSGGSAGTADGSGAKVAGSPRAAPRAAAGAVAGAATGAGTEAATGAVTIAQSGRPEDRGATVDQPPIAGLVGASPVGVPAAIDATSESAPAEPPTAPSEKTHVTSPREVEEAPSRREPAAPEPEVPEPEVRSETEGSVASHRPKTPRLRFPDRF